LILLSDNQPVLIFQQFAKENPSGRDDVVKYQLSLPNVEDLQAERGIDVSQETVRFWLNGRCADQPKASWARAASPWRRHLDEVLVED